MSENKAIEKLKDHDERFDRIDKRFDRIERILGLNDTRFERVFLRMLKIENKIDISEGALKSKTDKDRDRILTAIDSIVKKNSDIDLEQLSTRVALDRHQDEIDSNKKDIIKIKKVVKIA